MEIYLLIIPVGLIFIALAIRLLFWALNSGQYDNLETEANRILFDEDIAHEPEQAPTPEPSGESSDRKD